jgi:hypothetical protein
MDSSAIIKLFIIPYYIIRSTAKISLTRYLRNNLANVTFICKAEFS